MRRINGPKLKKYIPCGYCFERWADCYDHIIPVAHGGTNKKSNLYPACKRCNSLVWAKLFSSLEEKRQWIQDKLKDRGEWHSADEMQRLREKIQKDQGVAEILFFPMPMERMERQPSALNHNCTTTGKKCTGHDECKRSCLWIEAINKAIKEFLLLSPAGENS